MHNFQLVTTFVSRRLFLNIFRARSNIFPLVLQPSVLRMYIFDSMVLRCFCICGFLRPGQPRPWVKTSWKFHELFILCWRLVFNCQILHFPGIFCSFRSIHSKTVYLFENGFHSKWLNKENLMQLQLQGTQSLQVHPRQFRTLVDFYQQRRWFCLAMDMVHFKEMSVLLTTWDRSVSGMSGSELKITSIKLELVWLILIISNRLRDTPKSS
jgi:hypothetical protein